MAIVNSGYGFTVGDIVESVIDHNQHNPDIMIGTTGVVKSIDTLRTLHIGVEWDHSIYDGHSCCHRCIHGRGYWVTEDSIRILEDVDNFNIPNVEYFFGEVLE